MVLSILICLRFANKVDADALINLCFTSCHDSGIADSNGDIPQRIQITECAQGVYTL